MSASKGQLLGIISDLKDELHSVDKMLGMCPEKCVSVGRAWHLCEDLENGLNGAIVTNVAEVRELDAQRDHILKEQQDLDDMDRAGKL